MGSVRHLSFCVIDINNNMFYLTTLDSGMVGRLCDGIIFSRV